MKKLYLFLIASLLISFAACSPGKQKDVPKKKVNYEEQKIELPPDVIEISCVKELGNGNLEMIASTKRKSGLLYERDAKSGEWEENQKIIDELGSGWLMNASSLNSGYFLKYMQDATMEEEYYLMDAQYNLQKIPIQIPEKLQSEASSFMDAYEVAEGVICGTNDGSGRFYLVDTATIRRVHARVYI